jgi:hypothetical protein
MEEGAVLRRLYEEELASDAFPAADAILWRVLEASRFGDPGPTGRVYDIYSSHQWLGALEDREPWQGAGWPDGAR